MVSYEVLVSFAGRLIRLYSDFTLDIIQATFKWFPLPDLTDEACTNTYEVTLNVIRNHFMAVKN